MNVTANKLIQEYPTEKIAKDMNRTMWKSKECKLPWYWFFPIKNIVRVKWWFKRVYWVLKEEGLL